MTILLSASRRGRSKGSRHSATAFILIAIACVVANTSDLEAQSDAARPAQIKAAFLYNFARFVEWPESNQGAVDICVLGDPASTVAVESIAGKIARGQPVRVASYASPRDARECHIVFVGPEWEARLPEVLSALDGSGALTVSDSEGFAEEGGMIGLKLRRNRFLIEINLTGIQAAGLKVSSQLLNLADIIDDASSATPSGS